MSQIILPSYGNKIKIDTSNTDVVVTQYYKGLEADPPIQFSHEAFMSMAHVVLGELGYQITVKEK